MSEISNVLGEIPKMEIYKFTKKAQLEVYYCESNSVLCENINAIHTDQMMIE